MCMRPGKRITRRSADRALDRAGTTGVPHVDSVLHAATAPPSTMELNGEADMVALFRATAASTAVAAGPVKIRMTFVQRARARMAAAKVGIAAGVAVVLVGGGVAYATGNLPVVPKPDWTRPAETPVKHSPGKGDDGRGGSDGTRPSDDPTKAPGGKPSSNPGNKPTTDPTSGTTDAPTNPADPDGNGNEKGNNGNGNGNGGNNGDGQGNNGNGNDGENGQGNGKGNSSGTTGNGQGSNNGQTGNGQGTNNGHSGEGNNGNGNGNGPKTPNPNKPTKTPKS